MITKMESALFYKCPICGACISGTAELFALSSAPLQLTCSVCKESAPGSISLRASGDIRVSIPCVICEGTHQHNLSRGIFFDRNSFVLACGATGVDICVLGNPDAARATYEEIDAHLEDIMEESETEDFFHDQSITFTILAAIQLLAEEQKLSCACGTAKTCKINLAYDSITLTCPDCDARLMFLTTSPEDIDTIEALKEIILPGTQA